MPTAPGTNKNLPDLSGGNLPDLSGGSLPDLSGGNLPDLSGGSLPDLSGGSLPNLGGVASVAAAPSKHGGGLLGFVSRAAHDVGSVVNPVHLAEGVGRLGEDLGKAPFDLGEKALNTGTQALLGEGGTHVGNAFARDTSWSKQSADNEINHALPAIGGAMRGAGETVEHAIGNAQALAGLPLQLLAAKNPITGQKSPLAGLLGHVDHPLGGGFEKQLGSDYSQHPVDALLNDAANLSLIAGGAGSALGAGDEAATEGAAQGASQSARAQAAAAAHGIGDTLGKVAAAPLIPFTHAGGALADLIGNTLDRGEAASAIRDSVKQGEVRPTDAAKANAGVLEGVTKDPQEFAAAMLRAQGHGPLLSLLTDNPATAPALDHTLSMLDNGQGIVTPDVARLAAHPTAEVTAAEQAIRSLSENRTGRELEGFGHKPGQGPLNPDQLTPQPRVGEMDKLHAKEGLTEEQAAEDLRAAPAKYRTPMTAARQAASDLTEQAKTADSSVAGDLQRIAGEAEQMGHLSFWQQQDEQPAHVIGSTPTEAASDELPKAGNGRGRLSNMKSTQQRETTNTDYSKKGFSTQELNNLKTAAHNEGIKVLLGKVGSSPRALLGDEAESMAGPELAAEAQKQGLVGYNPNASSVATIGVAPENMTADTNLVPEPVLEQLQAQMAKQKPANFAQLAAQHIGKGLDFATRHAYRDVLGLTPHYSAIRSIGDALIAHVRGDVPLEDFPRLIKQGWSEMRSGDIPAALKEHLNDENLGGGVGVKGLGRVSRVTQFMPRFLDGMARTVVYLHKVEEGAAPEEAVVAANKAMGDMASMSVGERNIASRIFPVYPWLKTVAGAAAELGWEHPASIVFATHLANLAANDPHAFKQNAIQSEMNPLSIFSGGGGLVNPIVRAAVGSTTGINVSKVGTQSDPSLKRAPNDRQHGPLSLKDLPYYIADQLPVGKLLIQSPLSGLDQNIARYPTGQPEIVGGKTVPSYLPPTKTPIGTFGSYFRTAAGDPENPQVNATGQARQAKAAKTAAHSAAAYAREIAALKARGIR